jgi:type III secretory pathway component EscS
VPVDPPEVVPDDNTQKSVNILWIVLPSVLGAVVVAAVVAVVVIVKKRRGVR